MKLAPSSYLTSVVLFAFFLLAFSANSEGYTLISNLDASPLSPTTTEGAGYELSIDPVGTVIKSYTTIAQSFSTGPDAVSIMSVTIKIGYGGTGTSGFKLTIHGGDESASTIFGSPLTPITENGDHPALPGFYSFATPNLTLQANTYYTLEASAVDVGTTSNSYQWSLNNTGYDDDSTPFGPSDFWIEQFHTLQQTLVIAEDGSDHVYVGNAAPVYYSTLQFSINAAPEPSRPLLLLAGLSLLALTRRRTV
jgi:hypothetical protein